MKHIKLFDSYRSNRRRDEIIKESVMQVNDIYKVKTIVDIPQSLINAYVKKVKSNTGKDLRQFFGDMDIAEEVVKWVTLNFLDVDKVPANALVGGAQAQGQGQAQPQMQAQPQAQPQAQTQAQPQAQPQGDNFEDIEPQGQGQGQGQAQGQGQGQAQGQGQVQVQTQGQNEEEEEEELPL